MSLKAEVGKGRLAGLRALRDRLALELEADLDAGQTAPLARQLRETLREIEALEAAQPRDSRVDELANRRQAGRAASARRRTPAKKAPVKRSRGA